MRRSVLLSIFVMACGAPPPIEHAHRETSIEAQSVTPAPARPFETDAERCPRPVLAHAPVPTDAAPEYTRDMWLSDSLLMTDLVVVGRVVSGDDGDAPRIAVERVVCGAAHDEHVEGDDRVVTYPYRVSGAQSGLWILARGPTGYVSLNPDVGPLSELEWGSLIANAVPATSEPPELTVHVEESQLRRTDPVSNLHRGVEVVIGRDPDRGYLDVRFLGGDPTIFARTLSDTELIVERRFEGDGFSLRMSGARVRSFTHYGNGRRVGLSRTVNEDGSPIEEASYVDGMLHGRARRWNPAGELTEDRVFERGLIPPVIHYEGPPGESRISHSPTDGATYSVPRDLLARVRVGMRAARVSSLLRADISTALGVRVLSTSVYRDGRETCYDGALIRFENERVSSIESDGTCSFGFGRL